MMMRNFMGSCQCQLIVASSERGPRGYNSEVSAGGAMAKVGVVLSGCGVFDGSEITEAVAMRVGLDRRGAQVTCLAPGGAQSGVVNHLTKEPDAHPRSVMEESARIARGKVSDLATARAADFDAIVFPGGFGGAKNLSDFASKGAQCAVHPEVRRI